MQQKKKQSSHKRVKNNLRRFIVCKYIYARSATEAIKIEKTKVPDDVYIHKEDQWMDTRVDETIGFSKEHQS